MRRILGAAVFIVALIASGLSLAVPAQAKPQVQVTSPDRADRPTDISARRYYRHRRYHVYGPYYRPYHRYYRWGRPYYWRPYYPRYYYQPYYSSPYYGPGYGYYGWGPRYYSWAPRYYGWGPRYYGCCGWGWGGRRFYGPAFGFGFGF